MPIPTPIKPVVAPAALLPAASIPLAIEPCTKPSRILGSPSMAPWLRILINLVESSV